MRSNAKLGRSSEISAEMVVVSARVLRMLSSASI